MDSPLFWLMLMLVGTGPAWLMAGLYIGMKHYKDQLAYARNETVHVKWHCDVFDEVLTRLVAARIVDTEHMRALIVEAERSLKDPAGYTCGHSLAEKFEEGKQP
jgi:hypothetical protein